MSLGVSPPPNLLQVEVFVVEMQDPKSGVKGADQKLNVTIIPHVINGESQHQMVATTERHISSNNIPSHLYYTMTMFCPRSFSWWSEI